MMAHPLRRSSRLKTKTVDTYTEPDSEESDFDQDGDNESAVSSSSESVYVPSDGEGGTICVCGDTDDNRLMICCDGCDIWYHHDCAKLTVSRANRLSKSNKKWFCPRCKSKR